MKLTRSTLESRVRAQGRHAGRTAFAHAGRMVALLACLALPALPLSPLSAAAQGSLPGSFADLSDRLSPAVVNISTAEIIDNMPGASEGEGSLPGEMLRDLQPEDGEMPRSVRSLGSGFVIDPSGVIVTNNHVIRNADEITVTFPDGLTLDATVVGIDKQTDLAVLRVTHDAPLPAVSFGDSDAARVGDWVLAIGNPFGFSGSVSAGIISARNRDINAGRYDDFLQTDAAINQGNSGGPLFNMAGEVIGVNTAIVSPTGGSIGIGFAVPSNLVSQVVAELREYGEMRRGWLGVRIRTVDDAMAEKLGLDRPHGALVAMVVPESPAAAAGIREGDVIIRLDGQDVATMHDLPGIVAATPIDKSVPVAVLRDGEEVTVTVTIGLLDEDMLAPAEGAPAQPPEPVELPRLGLTVSTLSPAAREKFGIADDLRGVLVTAVAPDSMAAARGVVPGDVILSAGQIPVEKPADIKRHITATEQAGRDTVVFLINSGGEQIFVPLTLTED